MPDRSDTMTWWPYQIRQEVIRHDDGTCEIKLLVTVIEGTIQSSMLPTPQRIQMATEEFAEVVTVEWHK